eukprot:gene5531-7211_t
MAEEAIQKLERKQEVPEVLEDLMSENIPGEPTIPENTPEPQINLDDIMKPEIDTESYRNWIREFIIDKARDILKSGQTGKAFFRTGHVIQNEYFEEMARKQGD